jgi:CDP-diacylglycerol--glycerol-3-phosphate 3-phosphatidyltransferase/CDP-diacylglycerol--inositol 3-phosphatidyltransferase
MLDRFKAFWQGVALAPFVNLFVKLGISPDVITLVGTLGVSAGALICFPQGWLWQGVVVVTCFVFSDLVDGAMARKIGRTDKFGAFLDSTLDRIADAALFGGMALYFAWQAEDRLYLALSLVCLAMGSVTSYARSKGEQLGFNAKTGLAERPDRLVGLLVPTFFGDVFGIPWLYEIALWVIAALSTITVVQRILLVRRQALAAAPPTDSTESAPSPPQH